MNDRIVQGSPGDGLTRLRLSMNLGLDEGLSQQKNNKGIDEQYGCDQADPKEFGAVKHTGRLRRGAPDTLCYLATKMLGLGCLLHNAGNTPG
jgi:hypothetical protein